MGVSGLVPYQLSFVSPRLKRLSALQRYLFSIQLELKLYLPHFVPEKISGEPVLLLSCTDSSTPRQVQVGFFESNGSYSSNFPRISPSGQVDSILYTNRKPIEAVMPFHYQRIPASIRNLFRGLLGRFSYEKHVKAQRVKEWYLSHFLSLESILELDVADLIQPGNSCDPYPSRKDFAFAITHDLDTEFGQSQIDELLKIEEELGFRSCSFVVPGSYPLNRSLLASLIRRGHEIGCHDINHDNHLAFLSSTEIRKRFDGISGFISNYHIEGFRSGSFLRTKAMLEVVQEYFQYDSSIPEKRTQPYLNGCFRQRPFQLLGTLVEIPVTLPTDGELLSHMLSPSEILEIWITKVRMLSIINGCGVFLNHPEKGFSDGERMRSLYEKFLTRLRDNFGTAWFCLPRELTHWFSKKETQNARA